MAEIIKETINTQQGTTDPVVLTPVTVKATNTQTIEYIIYFILGVIDILLAFRLVLKLMGASTASGFVRAIYGVSGFFTMPFEGIFSRGFTEGIETTSVFEPSTVVALIVYAVLAWGIVQLVRILSREQTVA